MRNIFTLGLYATVLVISSLLTGCGSEKEMEQEFDRSAVLSGYATNVIQPAFQDLLVRVNDLNLKSQQFVDDPTANNLEAAQSSWQSAFLAWQSANAFNFGPAGEDGLRKSLIEEIGTWPVATTKVEVAITNEDHSLSGFDRDARGFLAIEYLLFRGETNGNNVLDEFVASTSRQDHLKALTNDLVERVNQVVDDWKVYEADFIANDGTDVGSSLSQLYNEWVRSFESIKNFKIGLPLGKRPGQTQSEPGLVEARYSETSLAAIAAHLQAIERIYYGGGVNGDEPMPSLKSYLDNVVGGPELVAQTEAQWAVVMEALAALPTDRRFQEMVAEEHPSLEVLHTELQRHTRFFKSDMSSILGIAITFSSGDGD